MFGTLPVIHDVYASLLYNYFFERYSSIFALFLSDLSSTHALSSNKPMIIPKTFLTPLRNVLYSSEFSTRASSTNSMLKEALLAYRGENANPWQTSQPRTDSQNSPHHAFIFSCSSETNFRVA